MAQQNLVFGTFTLCSPGAGKADSYDASALQLARPDVREVPIPWTYGRLGLVTGYASSGATCRRYQFTGISEFSSAANLATGLTNAETAMAFAATLSYGLADGSTATLANCLMAFSPGQVSKGTDGTYYLEWTAEFEQF